MNPMLFLISLYIIPIYAQFIAPPSRTFKIPEHQHIHDIKPEPPRKAFASKINRNLKAFPIIDSQDYEDQEDQILPPSRDLDFYQNLDQVDQIPSLEPTLNKNDASYIQSGEFKGEYIKSGEFKSQESHPVSRAQGYATDSPPTGGYVTEGYVTQGYVTPETCPDEESYVTSPEEAILGNVTVEEDEYLSNNVRYVIKK